MNLEQFAGYLAATSILVNIDSYIGMPHNYYLLMDKADGKLRMLPWDLNETFGTFTMGRSPEILVKWDIDRPWISKRRIVERLFSTEQFPKLYRNALTKLMKNDFTEKKYFARIEEFEKAIARACEKGHRWPRIGGTPDGHQRRQRRHQSGGEPAGPGHQTVHHPAHRVGEFPVGRQKRR